MTNWNRSKRGLADNPFCATCESAYEDVDHVFRLCPRASAIRQFFTSINLGTKGYNGEFHTWLLLNLKDTEQEVTWPAKFLLILWYIWKWRNGVCFDRTTFIPHHKIQFLLEKCDEVIRALIKEAQDSRKGEVGRHETLIRWCSPLTGRTLLNTNGASKGNPGRACGGGVLRGDRGEWLCGFGESMGVCTSMKAEIKAVLRGLRITRSLAITRLWVQVDSLSLVGLLKGDSQACAEHAPISINAELSSIKKGGTCSSRIVTVKPTKWRMRWQTWDAIFRSVLLCMMFPVPRLDKCFLLIV